MMEMRQTPNTSLNDQRSECIVVLAVGMFARAMDHGSSLNVVDGICRVKAIAVRQPEQRFRECVRTSVLAGLSPCGHSHANGRLSSRAIAFALTSSSLPL